MADERRRRISRFLRRILVANGLMHVPFSLAAFEAARRAGAGTWAATGIAVVAAALGMALFMGRLRGQIEDAPKSALRVWLIDMPYFVHWCACLWLLIPGVIGILAMPFTGAHFGFFLTTYEIGACIAAYGIFVRRRWFVVREVDVRVRDLPPAFDGYTIAHLSDLHIGGYTPAEVAMRWVRAANARKPDLTVVTGDLVTNGTNFHHAIADVLGKLEAKDGAFVSMGNHDYFGDGEPLISLMKAAGITVLRNEGKVLEKGADKMYLAAIDDTWTRRADIEKALEHRPSGMRTILLAHDPDEFDEAAARDVSLTLSGHTHGGQVAFPFLAKWVTPSRIAHNYSLGLYQKDKSVLYVHPGLGTTGPPIRLGAAPAVVMLKLRAA
jgi:predicted MPP superfamily phosphohydrolase